jgi:hypothetical protein
MPNSQIACPYCKSMLSITDDIAPGTALPCRVCQCAFIPQIDGAASKHAVTPAGNSRALVAGGLIFAGSAVLLLGGMSVVLWLAFGRRVPAAEVAAEPAPVVVQANSPAPETSSTPDSEPAPPVAPAMKPATPEPDDDLAAVKKPVAAPQPSVPTADPGRRSDPLPPPLPAPRMPVAAMNADRPGADQQRINAAIDRGVRYLKDTQNQKTAIWPGGPEIGFTALAGLTLLECKVPPTDPSVLKAAGYIRKNVETFQHKSETYELSLAILFLDRLGNPKDDPLIQQMALRLLSGQNNAGGWTYRSAHQLTKTQRNQLLVFLRSHEPPLMPKLLARPAEPGKQLTTPDGLPRVVQEPKPGETRYKQISNTAPEPMDSKIIKAFEVKEPSPDVPKQVAAKQPRKIAPIPVKNLVYPLQKLPVTELSAKKGVVKLPPTGRGEDNSNTQFALMGLWAARRHGVPVEYSLLFAQQRFVASQDPIDGGWGYHVLQRSKDTMTCVGLIGLAMGHGIHVEMGKNKAMQQDAVIQKGLLALSRYIDTASREQPNLYFMWSLERVAMLYDLKTIGGKDWYAWGAPILVAKQRPEGCWVNGKYPGSNPHCDTCFALLFLKRSNLVADLTENLRMHMIIRDPEAKGAGPGGASSAKSPNP